jgi:hypothetical protein
VARPGTYPARMAERLANRNDPGDREERSDDGWLDLAVANPTFLLERLGGECGDLQSLRELTVNGLDAIAAQHDPASGRVVWDLDWQRLEASAGKVRKLTVTDTGTGMRPDQLGRYINQLASSSREQSHSASDHRPNRPLAQALSRRPRRTDGNRSACARMVRADPRRGRARRPQLGLESRTARRPPLPTAFTAALLPRHLLNAMLQKRLAQKLGAPRAATSR